MADVH